MFLFFSLLLLLAVVAIVDSIRELRTDGYGRWSSPPRSHVEDYPQWALR